MTEVKLVLITAPTDQAERLAGALLEARLAACINLLPAIRSLYRWQGRVHNDAETLLLVKTTQDRLPELTDWLQAQHPYDVPELLVLPIESGLPAYLNWVGEETQTEPAR